MIEIIFTLSKRLHRLQGSTRRFAKGEYDIRAEISSRDEIGDLSKTFNYMAKTIESKMEELKDAVRRQEEFTANFAHELKTPLTVILANLRILLSHKDATIRDELQWVESTQEEAGRMK